MAVTTDAAKADKALNLCSRAASACDLIMSGIEQLAALKAEKESSGLNLTAAETEAALAASSLKHANGDNFNSVLGGGATLKTWMEDQFLDDVFQAVRP